MRRGKKSRFRRGARKGRRRVSRKYFISRGGTRL